MAWASLCLIIMGLLIWLITGDVEALVYMSILAVGIGGIGISTWLYWKKKQREEP